MNETLRGFPGAPKPGEMVTIDFEGTPVPAAAGEPVAVSLFAAGIRTLGRSTKYHRPRGLFCLDGHCASCYMRIDGRPNRRACMVPARAGLPCERQNAFPSADVDLLAAADWLFPRGMDHHTLMTGSRAGNAMFLKMVREMGGSGTLPADAAPPTATTDEVVDACVIGGGPAGLGAAREIARAAAGARVAVFDEQDAPGGSLHAEPGGSARARELADQARAAGVRLTSNATAIGFFPEDVGANGSPGVLAVATEAGLVRVSARRTLYATGAYDQNLPVRGQRSPGRDRRARSRPPRVPLGHPARVAGRTPRHPRCGGDDRAPGTGARASRRRVRARERRARRGRGRPGRQAAAGRRGGVPAGQDPDRGR